MSQMMRCPKAKECQITCEHSGESHKENSFCQSACEQFIEIARCQPVDPFDALVLRHATPQQLLDELKSRPGVQVLREVSFPSEQGLDDTPKVLGDNEYLVVLPEEKP
jgi:hypothetical protein